MTPLTHAAVGTLIFQKLRIRKLGPLGWVLGLLLALASHYLLDAIPHFENVGPLKYYMGGMLIFVGLGGLGVIVSVLLLRRNREAGWIFLILSLWVALGNPEYPLLRLTTALLGLGFLAWKSRQAKAVGCLLAGMLAVAPDLMPATTTAMERLHLVFHYRVDWATRLHRAFGGAPVPAHWQARLQDPYFLMGYALQLVVEAIIFFGALYLLSRQRFIWPSPGQPGASRPEMADLTEETAGRLR